jgi:hypothetical protein
VARSEFERLRTFYKDVLELQVVFADPGHISCVGAGAELGICVHEEEPGHPAGTRELFFYVDDFEPYAERALGAHVVAAYRSRSRAWREGEMARL